MGLKQNLISFCPPLIPCWIWVWNRVWHHLTPLGVKKGVLQDGEKSILDIASPNHTPKHAWKKDSQKLLKWYCSRLLRQMNIQSLNINIKKRLFPTTELQSYWWVIYKIWRKCNPYSKKTRTWKGKSDNQFLKKEKKCIFDQGCKSVLSVKLSIFLVFLF